MKLGITRLQRRIDQINKFDPAAVQKRDAPEVKAIQASIDQTLTDTFGHDTIEYKRYSSATILDNGGIWGALTTDSRGGYMSVDMTAVRRYLAEGKQQALLLLQQAIQGLEEIIADREGLAAGLPMAAEAAPTLEMSKIFVAHGHDEGAWQAVARFLEKLDLKAIILKEQPNRGRTLIEKFVDYAREVGFAVVVLTPDDLGGAAADEDQKSRARQNVIFELGYFVGSLGRGRACLLRKGEVEIPSDLYGVVYTSMDGANGWKIELARELKDAGFEFEADKVLA